MEQRTGDDMQTDAITAAPLRIGLGQPFRPAQAAGAGTIIVREAAPFGQRAVFATQTPCCGRNAQINAVAWGAAGAPHTCADCGWKWTVYLARDGERIGDPPRDARHGNDHAVRANQAEWESRGFGREPRRARRRW
jgi:hypothetical protein